MLSNADTEQLQKISLPRLSSTLSKVDLTTLIGFLQTFYEESMVIQGHLAAVQSQMHEFLDDHLINRQVQKARCALLNVSEALSQTQILSGLIGEAKSFYSAELRSWQNSTSIMNSISGTSLTCTVSPKPESLSS